MERAAKSSPYFIARKGTKHMWNMYWFPRAHNEKGNNLETLEVFVDHVIYRNESNGYCVLSADYEEEELIVTGIFQGDVQGAMLRVTGKMEYNANYGEQFKMQQYEIIEPTDAESIRSTEHRTYIVQTTNIVQHYYQRQFFNLFKLFGTDTVQFCYFQFTHTSFLLLCSCPQR